MTKVYTNKSNATRAAKAFAAKHGTEFDVTGSNEAGFHAVAVCTTAVLVEAAKAAGLAVVDHSNTGKTNLQDLGLYGAGTEAAPVCPHCGVNHMDNGYQDFVGVREAGGTITFSYVCLGCAGEWGPVAPAFASIFEGYKAAGNSKCKSLRLTANEWAAGDRKGFIAAATAYGIKATTASANWACMLRGEF